MKKYAYRKCIVLSIALAILGTILPIAREIIRLKIVQKSVILLSNR